MLKIFNKQNSGFSIMEVIVAISIVTVGMLGVLSLVTYSLKVQGSSKNFMTASMLAQEGIELVRNIRDTNWMNGDDWLLGTGAGSVTDILQDGHYTIDYAGNINDAVTTINDAQTRLFLNGNGFYIHGGGISTPFFRIVEVVETDTDNIINVRCRVRWSSGGQDQNYVAETEMYNWLNL